MYAWINTQKQAPGWQRESATNVIRYLESHEEPEATATSQPPAETPAPTAQPPSESQECLDARKAFGEAWAAEQRAKEAHQDATEEVQFRQYSLGLAKAALAEAEKKLLTAKGADYERWTLQVGILKGQVANLERGVSEALADWKAKESALAAATEARILAHERVDALC
jgi:hypothetical protein